MARKTAKAKDRHTPSKPRRPDDMHKRISELLTLRKKGPWTAQLEDELVKLQKVRRGD